MDVVVEQLNRDRAHLLRHIVRTFLTERLDDRLVADADFLHAVLEILVHFRHSRIVLVLTNFLLCLALFQVLL